MSTVKNVQRAQIDGKEVTAEQLIGWLERDAEAIFQLGYIIKHDEKVRIAIVEHILNYHNNNNGKSGQ